MLTTKNSFSDGRVEYYGIKADVTPENTIYKEQGTTIDCLDTNEVYVLIRDSDDISTKGYWHLKID